MTAGGAQRWVKAPIGMSPPFQLPSGMRVAMALQVRKYDLSSITYFSANVFKVSLKQVINIAGEYHGVTGCANFVYKVNTVTGRGGTASLRVDATLDNTPAAESCRRRPSF